VPGVTLRELDGMGEEAFVETLGAIFEHSSWVARGAWPQRPFGSVEALHGALEAAMRAAPREAQVELIRAHPELAGREARAGGLTEASAREQAGAGLDRLSAGEVAALRDLNRAYRQRLGFPLVVCVREHTPQSILAWGRERLHRAPDAEIETALGEIAKIARMRLDDLVSEDAP
jgi:OHCU decarboxylase